MKSQRELQAEYLRAHIAERPLPGNRAIVEADAAATAQLVAGLYHRLDQVEAGVTPASCRTVEQLQRWADLCDVPRKGAVAARRALALAVRGSDGSYVEPGDLLGHGQRLYRVTSQAVIVDARGRCGLEAVEPGEAGKLARGAALRFRLPRPGIAESASLVLDLSEGGWDIEPFGAWRDRVSAVWAHRGQGGNATDYQQWCEALDFVAHAYVYKRKPTHGHVSIACTLPGYGPARALSTAQRAEVLAYLLDGRKPVCSRVHILETFPIAVHGRIALTTYADAAPTWSHPDPVVVTGWDASSRKLSLDPFPADLGIGDYLSIECIAGDKPTSTGEAVIVTAAQSASVHVAPARPRGVAFGGYQPVAGDIAHPSSATAYQVWRQVLYGYATGAGADPSGDAGESGHFAPGLVHLGPANVDGKHGTWQADVQRARVVANAIAVAGVRSATIEIEAVAPGADYLSTEWPFPKQDRVALLVPGEWLVLS